MFDLLFPLIHVLDSCSRSFIVLIDSLFSFILCHSMFRPSFGGVLIGMTVGSWVSDYLYVTTFAVLKQHWIVLLLSALFIPLFALLGACLPSSWKRPFFIVTISLTGAYLFCWGVGAYATYFPSVVLLEELVISTLLCPLSFTFILSGSTLAVHCLHLWYFVAGYRWISHSVLCHRCL